MKPNDQPTDEIVAATDEFFKDQPVRPKEAPAPDDSPTPSVGSEAASVSKPQNSPPLQDYVRELQQEFEEQEEEGKL
jgi:hypothetical protein